LTHSPGRNIRIANATRQGAIHARAPMRVTTEQWDYVGTVPSTLGPTSTGAVGNAWRAPDIPALMNSTLRP